VYRIYKPNHSDTTYAIKLSPQGASILDTSTRNLTFVDGDFETIHQALGTYLLRQMKVDAGYSEIIMWVLLILLENRLYACSINDDANR
jgi:hypothetical protein